MKSIIKAIVCYLLAISTYILSAQQTYPPNMYADTAFAPFLYGVASGDPLAHRVIIWTKLEVTDTTINQVPVSWQISRDSLFRGLNNSGTAVAYKQYDYTVKVDATELSQGETYYYRFITTDGKNSQVGIAKTLPPDTTTHFKLAVVSCSSIWSGYFNAYKRIAERSEIDYVIHLGDYVYDFVDKDEQVRMPTPYPTDPTTLDEWRERHKYYLLDPDLRAARQNKTWIAEWDNHDTDVNHKDNRQDAIETFYEYLPIRMPDYNHPERIYRTFHFGKLADLMMIDMHLFRGKEEYAPGEGSVLGNVQDDWFKKQLLTSTAKWKLVGNQEMMGSWMSEGLPKFINVPGNGKVFDTGNWDGYPNDRARLYNYIDSNHINNFVVMTGDAHMSFVMDLTATPKDRHLYKRRTGKGAVGVEVLGPSISRGNMDERPSIPKAFIPLIQSISKDINPHHVWCQFTKHGYVTLDVTPERCRADFWYSDILKQTNKETFARGYQVKDGENHWRHKAIKRKQKK